MSERQEPVDLQQMLERINQAKHHKGDQVSVGDVVSEVGSRSFGPLLVVAGIITAMPIVGDIPGVPTIMALFVLIVAGQLLFRREFFWLPDSLLKRSVAQDKLDKALKWMRPPARFIDRFLRPRLTAFTHGAGTYAVAAVCIVIALSMPPMEVVPFTANGAGLALTLFGLSLMANDGLLALLAFVSTAVTLGFVFYGLA
ncbi:exopolysaccharide biosynthesis protein [Halomonas sp. McH1-25]|uniref:exopolysaccharide biosynthesis protein n=1 Tax=unclassified Halomonas TaxID=2609666 RepID=UPI001EF6BFBD|nr:MULTISPECIES: exopolysaccharide biosynthesis protein [unclassified Halomonas]MCG7600378.1 exopolysaccharide biosynthesis protein [Halomonas sp. McH1-25]MCP1344000.1 exopolysaccharide biosynthesis protein [Halomonas sp. FL8]MCP1361504.1 exopolysaccharide biosynthesis protein [Halomonas sp. BBD45]MCP1365426.1 exopolysaccharide biosynthesis protein [Halomonas sp. BBD48]